MKPIDQHNEVMYKLGELSSGIKSINSHLATINGRLGKHDEQIDELDNWRSSVKGMVAVITFVASTIVSVTIITIKWMISK